MDQLHARSGCIYIIGCLLRPGTLTFATDLEHTYFSPDTDVNDLYNIFQLQYCGMPYYIIEIPHSSYQIAKTLADALGLKMVNGKPSSVGQAQPSDPPFGLVCSASHCWTLETQHSLTSSTSTSTSTSTPWSELLKDEQEHVRQRLKMTSTVINNEQKDN